MDIAVDALARLIYGELYRCSLSPLSLAPAASLRNLCMLLCCPRNVCWSLHTQHWTELTDGMIAPAGLDDGAPLTSEDTASFQKVVAGAFPDVPQVDQLVQDSIAGRSGRKGAYL